MQTQYTVITKIGNNADGSARCVKYRVRNLIKYVQFLDHAHPSWTWTNVYEKDTGQKVGQFTKFARPTSPRM